LSVVSAYKHFGIVCASLLYLNMLQCLQAMVCQFRPHAEVEFKTH